MKYFMQVDDETVDMDEVSKDTTETDIDEDNDDDDDDDLIEEVESEDEKTE